MPEVIVDFLEVVQVDQDEAERTSFAQPPRVFARKNPSRITR